MPIPGFLRVALSITWVLVLAGCVSQPPKLDVEVDVCCEARFEQYSTYAVSMTNVPGFLEAYLRGGLTTVLAGKGLEQTAGRPDLDVRLIFDQLYIDNDAVEKDSMGEPVAAGDDVRFVAAVSVDVLDASANRIVWSGRLSRIRSNPLGQPRGNDHKMQGIIDGFAALFRDYPIRLTDTP